MAADEYDPLLGLILQGTGNNNNSWGTTLNNQGITPAARAIAGLNEISDTGGSVDISSSVPLAGMRSDIDAIQLVNGTLSSDLTITVTNKSKSWLFLNETTGNFHVYVKTASGTARQLPRGKMVTIICDGDDTLYRSDDNEVGTLVLSAVDTASGGSVLCDGTSYLRTALPDLFLKIGTDYGAADGTHFNVPDYVTNNRFLRAAGGSVAVGTYQSSQNKAHTHTGSGTTGSNSVGHTHTYSGSTGTESAAHTHAGVAVSSSASSTGGGAFAIVGSLIFGATGSESATHTHSYSGTSSGESASHTHSFSFTTSSDGGTEARPEAAAVLICIVY